MNEIFVQIKFGNWKRGSGNKSFYLTLSCKHAKISRPDQPFPFPVLRSLLRSGLRRRFRFRCKASDSAPGKSVFLRSSRPACRSRLKPEIQFCVFLDAQSGKMQALVIKGYFIISAKMFH